MDKVKAYTLAEMLTREALADLRRYRDQKGSTGSSGQVHALVESAMERLERATAAFEQAE